jgi:hypothetical protein
MLTSAQIIARSHSEIASKTEELIISNQILSSEIKDLEVTPFGSNLFAILIAFDRIGGLRSVTYRALEGLRSKVKIGLSRPIKPKLGMSASCTVGEEGPDHFVLLYTALAGLKSLVRKMQNKVGKVSSGLKSTIELVFVDRSWDINLLAGLKSVFDLVFVDRSWNISPKSGLLSMILKTIALSQGKETKLGLSIDISAVWTPFI